MLRDYLDIFAAWTATGINLVDTRFPVLVRNPTTPDGIPDLADVVYGIHRCTHGHGDELPDGFGLTPHGTFPDCQRSLLKIVIENGSVRLPDLTVIGLCMVAVAAPVS